MSRKWKFVARPTCWWPVTFNVPADGGTVEKVEFELRLVRLPEDEFETHFVRGFETALAKLGPDATDEAKAAAGKAHDRELFDLVVKGWRGFEGESDTEVPHFTPENVSAMFQVRGFRTAFGIAYARFWGAVPEAREKNSDASPDGGPATATPMPAGTTNGDATSSAPSASGAPATTT